MVRQAHHPEPSRRVNPKNQYPMTKTILSSYGFTGISLLNLVCDFEFEYWKLFGI